MIQILADGVVAYDSRLRQPGNDYSLLGLKTVSALNKGGTAEIYMRSGHPAYDLYIGLRTIVEIYRDSKLRWRGRALYPKDDRIGRRKVLCEGELCFFRDGTSRPYLYQDSPENIFVAVVNDYNSQVESFKQFRVGQVTVTDPNNYIRLESSMAEQSLRCHAGRNLDHQDKPQEHSPDPYHHVCVRLCDRHHRYGRDRYLQLDALTGAGQADPERHLRLSHHLLHDL